MTYDATSRTPQLKQRQGFALLAAMWLIVAIATIALEFGLQAHERREATVDLDEQAEARAAAMAGIETERARLVQMRMQLDQNQSIPGINPDHPYRSLVYDVLTRTDSGTVGTMSFMVRIAKDALLNINLMSEDMWRNFLIGVGVDYDTADRLAQAIMDWRDPDDLPRPRGAERDAYIQAGVLVLPANKNFATVHELRDVMGMTPEIYAIISPYLSVCTSGKIDVNAAPAAVLYALPGFSDEIVSTILSERAAQPFVSTDQERFSAVARKRLTDNDSVLSRIINSNYMMGLVAVSTGWSPGGHTHVTAEALLDQNANILWRCEE